MIPLTHAQRNTHLALTGTFQACPVDPQHTARIMRIATGEVRCADCDWAGMRTLLTVAPDPEEEQC